MSIRLFVIWIFLLVFPSLRAEAQDVLYNEEDVVIYNNFIKEFKGQENKPIDEVLIQTARYFLSKPYKSSTLEVSDEERLVVNLQEFDCTTFVETCIALSNTLKSGNYSFESYCSQLKSIRYRNGLIDGYTSRLHYASDWIYENSKKGLFENISLTIGGKAIYKPLNFMSAHPASYKQLSNSPNNISKIKKQEELINERESYEVIDIPTIAACQTGIKNGDIVLFATSVPGLDYSHMGIAYRKGGVLHFIHASSKYKQVVIEPKSLSDYCKGSKKCTGISVVRLK